MLFDATSGTWWPRLSAIAFIGALSTAAPRAGAQISVSNLSAQAGITSECASHAASWGDVNGDGRVNLQVKWPSDRLDTYNKVAADQIHIATEPAGVQQANY
jgi:hypothetical protein